MANSNLTNVFGTFSHEFPAPPVVDPVPEQEPAGISPEEEPGVLPPEAIVSDRTGLIKMPSMRVDGDTEAKPWNYPEAGLWQWLSEYPIELVEERVLDGGSGVFWARMRDEKGTIRSVFLKSDGIGKDFVYKNYGDEFLLDPTKHDLLRRESAAYEVAKACGCEDLVAPLALKDVNPVELLSDAAREKLGKKLRIAPQAVDQTMGIASVVQMAPRDFDNLAEKWAVLGPTNDARWSAASDRLRHSLYRALALDFLLGTPDRLVSSYLYNTNTDRLNITDLSLSFPHPGLSAEKYIQQRARGWGRRNYAGLDKPAEAMPPIAQDFWRLSQSLGEQHTAECLLVFEQISDGLSDDLMVLLASVLVEQGVPDPCVAGFLARVAYLSIDPLAVIRRPGDLLRNVFVPMRKGFGAGESVGAQVVEYVSEILARASGEPFDLTAVVADQAPSDLFLKI